MLFLSWGLGVAFFFGMLLGFLVVLAENKQRVVTGWNFLRGLRRGDFDGHQAVTTILGALGGAGSHLVIAGRGPAFSDGPIEITFPWGTSSLSLDQVNVFPVEKDPATSHLVQSGPVRLVRSDAQTTS